MSPQSACAIAVSSGGPITAQPSGPNDRVTGRRCTGDLAAGAQSQGLARPYRPGNRRHPRVLLGRGLIPRKAGKGRSHHRPAAVGKAFHQLGPRPRRRLPNPSAATAGGACRQPHRQRLGLILGQPGQPRAIVEAQLDPALRPAMGQDRQPRLAQRIDVAQDRPRIDLQFARQRRGRQPPPVLQQQQDLQQPRGAHGSYLT